MSETRVGSCGLGTMGAAMAARIEAGLVACGHADDDTAPAHAVCEWSRL